jgi:AraC-like DNA-binding protein
MNHSTNTAYNKFIFEHSKYLFCQPGYNIEGLRYSEYYVPYTNPASGCVSIFYEAYAWASNIDIPIIPDGCIDLVIAFSNGRCAGISICGTVTTMHRMKLRNNDYFFGMRFKPGKCPFLPNGAAKEYMDNQNIVTMRDKDYNFVTDLINAGDFNERVSLASRYIGSEYERSFDSANLCRQNMVDYTMQCIYASGGNASIKKISDDLIYSPRYLEYVFREETGFTPKNMCQLTRIHRAVLLLLGDKQNNRTIISQECGYSDLSHMNRDLNKVLGLNSTKINNFDFYYSDLNGKSTVYNF